MRKNLLVGLVLAAAAIVVVFASDWFDLELESVALLGVAVGGVIAIVPHRSALMPLAGFGGGVLLTLVGYLVRAGLLPDSTGGRAVFVALVILLVAALATLSGGRLPLWATLLGAAVFSGAYEATYAAAPPEVASTSVSMLTALVLTVAIGFFAASTIVTAEPVTRARRAHRPDSQEETHRLNDMMETK